jgi:ornithine carbamoyltransferase
MLAQDAPPDLDPAGYLVSEKLDGARALWDGAHLRFRGGGLVAAPAWFTAALPPQALDGELWAGRGGFESTVGIVRRARPDVLVMHPGPINRGVEISPEVADGPNSVILEQVSNGLALRMALMYLLLGDEGGGDAAA